MKKLMTVLGVTAFALGAFADLVLPTGTGFESYPTGVFNYLKDDQGEDDANKYWVTDAGADGIEATVENYDGNAYAGAVPAKYKDDADNTNYLHIASTSATLYRSIAPVTGDQVKNALLATAQPIGDGLYIDTLVQLSVCEKEDGQTKTAEDGAKLAIWAEGNEDGTNFVVQAGYGNGNTPTNYVMATPSDSFDWSGWHRLTLKAIADIGNGNPGFVVFVDGDALERQDPSSIGFTPGSKVDSNFIGAVLPSLVSSGDYKAKLSAIGFNGEGCVDDISFTDVAPDFAADASFYSAVAGAGVSSIVCGEYPLIAIPLSEQMIDVTYADGYSPSAPDVDGNATVTVSATSGNVVTYTVTGATAGDVITFSGFQPVVTVDVAGTVTPYATIGAAFDAVVLNGGTVALVSDVQAVANKGLRLNKNVNVVLDLAGHKITGASGDYVLAVDAGSLIVTNSTVVVGEIDAGVGEGVWASGGGITKIYGGKFTGPFEYDGDDNIYDALEIYGGQFDVVSWGAKEDLEEVAEDTVSGPTAGYYTVGGEVPPAADTYTVTYYTNGWEYASATYTLNDASTFTPPENPVVDGYDFVDWFTDDGTFETAFVFDATVESDTSVYAKFKETTYTFTVAQIDNATATYTVDGVASAALTGLTNGTEVVVTYTADTNYRFTTATEGDAEKAYAINGVNGTSAGQVVVERIPYAGTVYEPWSYASASGVILWRGTQNDFHASTVADVAADGTVGDEYTMNTAQWHRFASNQSQYVSPGLVLVYDAPGTDQGYKYNPDCSFTPLSFGGMWVKTLAINGLPFSILGSGSRSTEFGAPNKSTFFKFDASYTIDRTGTTTFYGDATVEIADGATFTAQANSSHVVAVDSSATLKLQGAGTLAVTTMNVAGTLDLSATTVPSISGNVALGGNSTLVLPAGTALDEAISLEVCSGTLSADGVVYVKVGDEEPVETALTISGGSITQITTGIQTEQTFTSEPYPDVVPAGYTYTYVTTDAVTIPAVTVNGTLKTSGPFTITDLDVANGADFEVVAGNTTVGCSADCKLKGNIKVDAGATLTNTRTDSLSYNHAMTVDIYGTLAMGATRWSIPANCTFKLHAGAQVTGPGDSLASLDFISGATKGLDVYAGEASSARIEGKVRVRANESRIWIGDNTTLVLESGIADGGGHHAGFKQVGPGTLEIHANSTGLSGNTSVMTQGTLRIVDTTLAFPVALQGSNSYLEIVATEAETTVPVDVTTANNNISFSGAGKASGSIVFAAEPSSAVQSFLQNNWVGTATLNYAITGASNGTAFKACLYGNANSTVCLGQGATNIFFADAAGTAPGVGTKLYFKGNVSVKNGWAYNMNTPPPVRSNETVIPELGADEDVTFTTRQDGNRTTFFRIQTLKNFAGTIAVQAVNDVLIDKVELAEIPEVGTLVVKATKAADTSVIAGTATAGDDYADLVFDTVGGVSGLYVALTPVAVPTAATGLTYDGTVKTGVAAGTGYTLVGNTGTAAGSYQATATLKSGYVWEGGATEAQTIDWSIAQKSVTATITLTVASAQLDAEKTTVGAYTAVDAVSFGDDTLTVNVDYTISGLDAQVSAAGDYDVTVQPAASGSNYTFEPAKATLTITASSSTYEVTGETAIGEDGSFTVPEGTTAIKIGDYTLEHGDGISIDGTKVTVLAPEVVEEAEQEAIVIDDDNDEVTLNVDLVEGLYYGVGVATSLDGGVSRPDTLTQFDGTNEGVILTVAKPEGDKGFFKVFVDIKE